MVHSVDCLQGAWWNFRLSCIYVASIPWLGHPGAGGYGDGTEQAMPGQSSVPLSGTDPSVVWFQLAI